MIYVDEMSTAESATLAEDIFVLKVCAYVAALTNNVNRDFRTRHGITLGASYYLGDSEFPQNYPPWAWATFWV